MSKMTELCAELDLQILRDKSSSDPKSGLWALGAVADDVAGAAGFRVTPWFASQAALERHCVEHHEAIIEQGVPEC